MAGLLIDDPVKLFNVIKDANVIPGDTIWLRSGTYAFFYEFKISGTQAAPILFKPYNSEEVIIKPNAGYYAMFFSNVHDITLEDLIIDGTNIEGMCAKVTDGAQRIVFDDCEIKNAPLTGILQSGGTSSSTIKNCTIHDCGTTKDDHGIYIADGTATINNNEIYNIVEGHGIQVYGGHSTTTIYSNYVHNSRFGIGCYSDTTLVYNNVCRSNTWNMRFRYDCLSIEAYHNTLIDGSGSNIDVRAMYQNAMVAKIYNNLVIGSVGSLFDMENANLADDCVEFYNNYFDQDTLTIDADDTDMVDLADNIIDEECTPVTDDAADGYKPGALNPAKGAGIAVASVTTDYGANARATPPTIGAWE